MSGPEPVKTIESRSGWGRSLHRRLRWAFFGLAVGPLLFLALILPWQSYHVSVEAAVSQQQEVAHKVTVEARAFLHETERNLRDVAREIQAYALTGDARDLRLSELIAAENRFLSVAMTDAAGQEVARVHYTEVITARDLRDVAETTAFRHPRTTGAAYYGPVRFDAITGEPSMDVAVPIFRPGDKTPDGVLVAVVRLKSIWHLVARAWTDERVRAFIVDGDGRVIAHGNPSVVLAETRFEVPENSGLGQGLGEGELGMGEDGKKGGQWAVLARSTIQLSDQRFTVVVEQPAQQALAPTLRIITVLLLLLLLGLVVAAALVSLARRRITRPLRALADAAERISAGTPGEPVPVLSRDEIGDLARAFNAMTGRLGQSIAALQTEVASRRVAEEALRALNETLEQRVSERTAALERELLERRRAEQALRASEQRVRAIMDNVVDGIVVIDTTGMVRSFNPAAEQIFGVRAADVLDGPLDFMMPQEDQESHRHSLRRYITTGHSRVLGLGREVTARHRDGHYFPLDLAISELVTEEGRFFIGVMRDISERKAVEEQLRTAKEQADRANQAKSEFLSSMSHELRTPLNAILGFAQLLDTGRRDPLSDKQRGFVQHIIKGGEHLLSLINEILDLARIEAGRVPLSIEVVDTRKVIDECLTLTRSLGESQAITLTDETAATELPRLQGDFTRVKQVLLNLLSNAVKYNRHGGAIRLAHMVVGEGRRLRLSVTDTGLGIAFERQGEVFRPFSRLGQEASTIEGTGIGLAITRRLVEQMNGSIGFSSVPGEGSIFWVELPLAFDKTDSNDGPQLAAIPGGGDVGIDTRAVVAAATGITLLYIEDNPDNQSLMRGVVEEMGNITFLAAAQAEPGIALARQHRPDVIIMDIDMPGMNGFQALARLRVLPETAAIPVIALSANALPGQIARGRAAGFSAYLVKPADLHVLAQAIEQAIRGKAATTQADPGERMAYSGSGA